MNNRAPDTTDDASVWMDRANCRDDDPEVFFDERAAGAALSACRYCPVREQCLAWALELEGALAASHRFGVYGGLTSKQRAKLRGGRARTGGQP
ncbi:WhiB family transcriptional regulator [Streptomyces sp. NPDC004031]